MAIADRILVLSLGNVLCEASIDAVDQSDLIHLYGGGTAARRRLVVGRTRAGGLAVPV